MPMQIAPDQAEKHIALAVETVIQKRPMLEPIVRSCAEILSEKTRLARQLEVESALAHLDLIPNRLLRGIPLLTEISLDFLRDPLGQAFWPILSVLQKTFGPIAADCSAIAAIHRQGKLDLCKLSRAYLNGETSVLGSAAEPAETSADMVVFVLNSVLATVLKALEPNVAGYLEKLQWSRGYCPICGSMPSISYLAEASDLGSEFLQGGGGQKYLHCSLCGHDWRFMRNRCPACDTEDKDVRLYFQLEEERCERVDVCLNCGAYLLNVDWRESTNRLPLDIAAIGMLHLDAWATQQGYHPLVQTPWNLTQ